MPADETSGDAFVDTNIWLYAFIEADDSRKTDLARSLLQALQPAVTLQVLNEICVNLLRRKVCTEAEVSQLITAFFGKYRVLMTTEAVLLEASRLRGTHSFSFWDSLIVSAALLSGASVLYTEDMQHGKVIDERLRIVNPFVSA